MDGKKKVETRGRKSLVEDEPTVRVGFCLPLTLYDLLVDMGQKSGKGYGFHIREACIEKYQSKIKRKTKRKAKK